MQRLAEVMGVGTMTLYGYFRSKDELLDALADAATGEGRGVPHFSSWRDELHAVVSSAHANLNRHPSLVELRFRRPLLRPEGLRFAERCFSVLLRAGFRPDEAASAYRLLFTYLFGFAGLSPQRRAEEDRRQAATIIRSLPADRYPSMTAHPEECSQAMAGQQRFDYGLQRILDGLETHQRFPNQDR